MTIDLKSYQSREETHEALSKLSKFELHQIAEELELSGHKRWSKEDLVRNILWFGRVLPLQREYIRNMPSVNFFPGC
jgi:hypothetical protein